jgi:hypothetical protein
VSPRFRDPRYLGDTGIQEILVSRTGGGGAGGAGEVMWLWRRRRRRGNVVVEMQVSVY